MKKILLLITMLFVASMSAYAQDEYPKFELAGTYTMMRHDIQILGNETIHGYGIGMQYNFARWFGLAGEWTATHGSSGPETFTQAGRIYVIPKVDTRVQTLMFGPRFSYRARAVTVFGHWLVGAGTNKFDDDIGTFNYDSYTKWQVVTAIGGGLDINLGKSVAIRAAQLDWVALDSDFSELGYDKGFYNNWRYQGGIVFKF